MSGHSKWSTIKRKKGANDAQRAKEFTKIARLITVAAQNGGDPAMNATLALAIDKARGVNMPKDNIDRAIKRGTGEGGGGTARLEEVVYEGYAPGNVAILVDCTTDNRNRTVGEVRSTIEKYGGRNAENGAVSWQFKTTGRILIEYATLEEIKSRENIKWNEKNKLDLPRLDPVKAEEFELSLYDLNGVEDVIVDENGVEITTEFSALNSVRKSIEDIGIKVTDAEHVKISSTIVELAEEEVIRLEGFIENIEELDDVQKVWTNASGF